MSRAAKRLDGMRRNPAADWTLADVAAVCRAHEMICDAPARGSHHTVSHPLMTEILTIPSRRPIKAVYIRKLVEFVDALEARRARS